jgi:hypothetical protein
MKHIILIILLQIIGTSLVYSCSCAGHDNVRYSFENSDFAFMAELVEIGFIGTPDSIIDTISTTNIRLTISCENCYKVYKFIPSKFYKNSIDQDTIEIYGPISSCGLPVELNKTFLVFTSLWKEKNVFYSNYCSGTIEANKSDCRTLEHFADKEYTNYLDSINTPINEYLTEQMNLNFSKYRPAPYCDYRFTLKISKSNRLMKIYCDGYYYRSLSRHIEYLGCKRKIKRAFKTTKIDWVNSKYEYYKNVVQYKEELIVIN